MLSSPEPRTAAVMTGTEWLVDAFDCPADPLRSVPVFEELFSQLVADLGLHPLSAAERGFAALNLYCCRPRRDWPWEKRLREMLGARHVSVRKLARGVRDQCAG
jgi:S-adenosylmethionine decarboxylase